MTDDSVLIRVIAEVTPYSGRHMWLLAIIHAGRSDAKYRWRVEAVRDGHVESSKRFSFMPSGERYARRMQREWGSTREIQRGREVLGRWPRSLFGDWGRR
jgi:hypothetical protein